MTVFWTGDLPGLYGVSGPGLLRDIDTEAGTEALAANGRSMLTDDAKLLESLRIITYHPI